MVVQLQFDKGFLELLNGFKIRAVVAKLADIIALRLFYPTGNAGLVDRIAEW